MSSSLGNPGPPPSPPPGPPPAVRAQPPGWRDPRLWVGIAIVAASVLIGVRVLAAADDTVAVWAVNRSVAPGEQLRDGDLVTHQVRFAAEADLDRYFTSDQTLPAELEVVRALGAGELLPRSALGAAEGGDTVQVALPVAPLRLPPTVGAGAVVDVYVTGSDGVDQSRGRPGPALVEVPVVAVPGVADTFGAGGDRQIVLGVPADEVADLYDLLAGFDSPTISIALHP